MASPALIGRLERWFRQIPDAKLVEHLNFNKNNLFCLTRFPCYDEKSLRKFRLQNEDERRIFARYSDSRLIKLHSAYVFLTLVLVMTSLYVSHKRMYVVNHNDLSKSLKYSAQTSAKVLNSDTSTFEFVNISRAYKFGCLLTNCTQLRGGHSLVEDLSKLPLYTLCYPKWSYLMPPLQDLGRPEAFKLSIMSLALFCFCCTLILVQLFDPKGDQTVLFLLTPSSFMHSLARQTRAIVLEMSTSLIHLKWHMINRLNEKKVKKGQLDAIETDMLQQLKFKFKERRDIERIYHLMYETNIQIDNRNQSKHDELNSYVDDCIPIVRTEWWRALLLRSNLFGNVFLTIVISLILGVTYVELHQLGIDVHNKQFLNQVASRLNSSNCRVWARELKYFGQDTSSALEQRPYVYIKPEMVPLKWGWYSVIVATTCYILPMISAFPLALSNCMTWWEVYNWYYEIRYQIALTLDILIFERVLKNPRHPNHMRLLECVQRWSRERQQSLASLSSGSVDMQADAFYHDADDNQPFAAGKTSQMPKTTDLVTSTSRPDELLLPDPSKFEMSHLRRMFAESNERIIILPLEPKITNRLGQDASIDARLGGSQARQQIALELMQKYYHGHETFVLELIEKSYVNMRLFMNSLEDYGGTIMCQTFWNSISFYVCCLMLLFKLKGDILHFFAPVMLVAIATLLLIIFNAIIGKFNAAVS